MSPLNIHPEEDMSVPKKKKSKTLKVMFGLAALVLVPVIGSTFAASITLNNNAGVQFAQGTVDTAQCDTDLTVEAGSAYLTPSGGSVGFHLETITISDINLASGCEGKTLVVSVDAGGSEPALIGTDTQLSIPITDANNLGTLSPASGFTADLSGSGASGQIVITIDDPIVPSDDVDKFLIQSS